MSKGVEGESGSKGKEFETPGSIGVKSRAYIGESSATTRRYKKIIALLAALVVALSGLAVYTLLGIPPNVSPPAPNMATPNSIPLPPNAVTPSTNLVAVPPHFGLLNGSSLQNANKTTLWIFYETSDKEYEWHKDTQPTFDVTVYGLLRTTQDQYVETTLTGPINSSVYPTMTTDKPINSAVSKTEVPDVKSFKQVITMDKKQWPYDGLYMLQGKHGGIYSWKIYFKICPATCPKDSSNNE